MLDKKRGLRRGEERTLKRRDRRTCIGGATFFLNVCVELSKKKKKNQLRTMLYATFHQLMFDNLKSPRRAYNPQR